MDSFLDMALLDDQTYQSILKLGNVSISVSAAEHLDAKDLTGFLTRHVNADYGELDFEKKFQNDLAMYQQKGEVRSVYLAPDGTKVYIVTQWHQPLTHVLLETELPKDG